MAIFRPSSADLKTSRFVPPYNEYTFDIAKISLGTQKVQATEETKLTVNFDLRIADNGAFKGKLVQVQAWVATLTQDEKDIIPETLDLSVVTRILHATRGYGSGTAEDERYNAAEGEPSLEFDPETKQLVGSDWNRMMGSQIMAIAGPRKTNAEYVQVEKYRPVA